jgi:hypothetical protein
MGTVCEPERCVGRGCYHQRLVKHFDGQSEVERCVSIQPVITRLCDEGAVGGRHAEPSGLQMHLRRCRSHVLWQRGELMASRGVETVQRRHALRDGRERRAAVELERLELAARAECFRKRTQLRRRRRREHAAAQRTREERGARGEGRGARGEERGARGEACGWACHLTGVGVGVRCVPSRIG